MYVQYVRAFEVIDIGAEIITYGKIVDLQCEGEWFDAASNMSSACNTVRACVLHIHIAKLTRIPEDYIVARLLNILSKIQYIFRR